MSQETLWQLRMEIRLCSLYYKDYKNSFGIDCHSVCDFMDGYADYLDELMRGSIPDYDDVNFFDLLSRYDTPENLWDWYGCFEAEPLPLPASEEDKAA